MYVNPSDPPTPRVVPYFHFPRVSPSFYSDKIDREMHQERRGIFITWAVHDVLQDSCHEGKERGDGKKGRTKRSRKFGGKRADTAQWEERNVRKRLPEDLAPRTTLGTMNDDVADRVSGQVCRGLFP